MTSPVTPLGVDVPEPDARTRVQAVWQRYARRGDRATVRGRAYTVYLVLLFALIYLVPVVYTASTSPPLLTVGSLTGAAPAVCALAVAVCWSAQLAGRFWGPLVIQPFVLHVFLSTELPPTAYLGAIARRRLAYAGVAVLLTAGTAAYLTTDLFDRFDSALQALTVTAATGALAAVGWLWGQVRPVVDNLTVAAGAGVLALAVALPAPVIEAGLWPVAGAVTMSAAVLGRAAFRSLRTLDLARLARESARAAQAEAYAWTGTLHHALDLYRPEPRGFTTALIRPDGRLRGYPAQGAIRALRTPGRALAAGTLLLVGGAALTLGASGAVAAARPAGGLGDGGAGAGPALALWIAGSVAVYVGSGWVSEMWRGLRDELTLAPLLGEWWGGTLARALIWPTLAVTVGAGLGGGLALLVHGPLQDGRPGPAVLLAAGSVALVLGARFLREMKLQLPLELLLPVMTPLGDLSGLRVVVWQFDGLVAVVIGVAVLNAVPSAPVATALALGLAACCVWSGLRRTGWAHRGLLARLRRG